MEAERNRVQGNRVISVWKVRTRTRMPRETYANNNNNNNCKSDEKKCVQCCISSKLVL